jgi:fucose 4-O-acetylase-like acetyltransferase
MEVKNMASSEQRMRVHPYYGILALLALVGLVAICGLRFISTLSGFRQAASSIGTIALVVLLFSLAFQFLPMFHEFPQRFQAASESR